MGYHRSLKVWQVSQGLAEQIYRITQGFPNHERFGLTSQMRRACSSISANVAEGSGRLGDRELMRYLKIARGSAAELDSHIDLAFRLQYLNRAEAADLLSRVLYVQRMLFRLIEAIRERVQPHTS